METTELLYVEDILSEREKARIIKDVEKDFSRNFSIHKVAPQKRAQSKGLVLPILIGLVSLFGAGVFIFFSSRSISLEIDREALANSTVISESEWVILEHYIELSNRTIQSKNREIELYREQIAEYDERLETLRELITTKREIDMAMDSERVSLAAQGKSIDEINTYLNQYKKEKVAALAPGMVENYSLSLEEMNNQIDKLLVEKNESARLLEEEIAQRDELVGEYERYVKDQSASRDDLVASASPIPPAGSGLYSYDSYVLGKYRTLFLMIANGEYENMAGEIREIRSVLNDPTSPMLEDINKSLLNDELSNLSLLALLYKEPLSSSKEEDRGNKILGMLDELEATAGLAANARDESVREEALDKLRSIVNTVPALASALALLAPESSLTEPAPIGPAFLGRTGKVSFNLISFESVPGVIISAGDSFAVYDDSGAEEGFELARGEITQIDGDQVKGRILTLTSTQSKPAEGDPVYLLPKVE